MANSAKDVAARIARIDRGVRAFQPAAASNKLPALLADFQKQSVFSKPAPTMSAIKVAAMRSLMQEQEARLRYPEQVSEAKRFLELLEDLTRRIRIVRQTDPQKISFALDSIDDLGWDSEISGIMERSVSLLDAIRVVQQDVDQYLKSYRRMPRSPSKNRTDHFTHKLTDDLLRLWKASGGPFGRDGLRLFTTFVSTTLVDLKYPFSEAQRDAGDLWLRDRIRKQTPEFKAK